jgi:NAD(P)-dependent dehydrogenase (short-subunit alcohol dehydrogenase family)
MTMTSQPRLNPTHRSLEGQTVVVIGGSRSIGYAVAELACKNGASVIAISRSGSAPAGVRGVAAHVADPAVLTAALQSAGVIDHLVHTASTPVGAPPLASLDEKAFSLAFDTKLFDALKAARLALPYLAPRASITLTSGQVSRKYGTGTLLKGMVNAAVDAAGHHLARELAPRRVNVVSPGVIDTSLWGEAGSDARTGLMATVAKVLPVERAGTPAEAAGAYLFLMTNAFVTGSVIDVNGGGLL